MTMRISPTLVRGILDGVVNSGAGGSFDSGTLEIRTGAQPTSAEDAETGTLLVSITLPADAFAAAATLSAAKSGTWQDASADGTGTAGWFRIRASGDAGGASTTTRRIDGAVTATGGGGQLELDNTSIATAQQVTINTASLSMATG